jgi:hypothetical protein
LIPVSSKNRQKRRKVLTQLRNLEVYTAQKIVQRWIVNHYNAEVEGRQRPGCVVLVQEDDILKIYLTRGYLEAERYPGELVEKLASFCGMDDRKDSKYLLLIVLTESNHARIAAELDNHGVPGFLEEGDGDEDDELNPSGSARNGKCRAGGVGNSANDLGGARGFSTETITIISSQSFGMGGFDEVRDDDEETLVGEDDFNPAVGDGLAGNGIEIFAFRSNRSGYAQNGVNDAIDEELAFQGELQVSKPVYRTTY